MPTDRPAGRTTPKKANNPKNLKPTSASEWKKSDTLYESDILLEEGFVTELPSGNVVRMTRRLDMTAMLTDGKIPNPLAGVVQKMIDERDPLGLVKNGNDDPRVSQQLLDLVNQIVIENVIEPPMAGPEPRGKVKDEATGKFIPESAEEYQDRLLNWQCPEGHVAVFQLTLEDRFYIFSVAQGAAADLARFRSESKRVMGNVSKSEGVRKQTKRTGGSGSKKK